jgi:hypothetical protein
VSDRYDVRRDTSVIGVKAEWGVWDNHTHTWATLEGIRCVGMTRWEARQVLGLSTGINVK